MPSTLFAPDSAFPDLSGPGTTDEKLAAVQDYLFLLLETLRWTLRNLSPANFNEKEMAAFFDKLEANVILSDTLITNELYAQYGAIADLTVDELRTDYQRAGRYLLGDTSPLDWLYIHDEEIDFISGTVRYADGAPCTEQLRHRGRCFWWTDETHTQMTSLEDTGDPVVVYQYDELLKGAMRFQSVTVGNQTVKIPTFVFGAGTGDPGDPDIGRGFIRKDPDSFDIWYHGASDNGVFIGQYTDLAGLRKTTRIDFSDWESGAFTETVDGGVTGAYAVTFDAQGRPVKITDGAGHETAVVWE